MDDNLSLFHANTHLFDRKDDRKFMDKYPLFSNWLSLFDKYRNCLKQICVNCNCDQNIDNKLYKKFGELENECNHLFAVNRTNACKLTKDISSVVQTQLNEPPVKRIKLDSNERNDCTQLNQHNIVVNERNENSKPIGDTSCDIGLIDAQITGKQSLMNESANYKEIAQTVVCENDSINKQIDFIDLTSDDLCDNNSDYSAKTTNESKIFKDHILGIETEEKPMSNCFVSSIVSKSNDTFNHVIGYRCKWPQCCFVESDLALVSEHLETIHKIHKQFMCSYCNNFFVNDCQLREHQELAHHKQCSEIARSIETREPIENVSKGKKRSIESKAQLTNAIKKGERILLKRHVIGIDTEDVLLMNQPLVTMLISKKPYTLNRLVGYRCQSPQCDYVSKQLKSVYQHLIGKHKQYRPIYEFVETVKDETNKEVVGYRCKWPQCDYFQSILASVCQHVNIKHIENPSLMCKFCGIEFQNLSSLLSHSNKHNDSSHAHHDEKCAKKNCSIGKCRFKLAKHRDTNRYFDFSKSS